MGESRRPHKGHPCYAGHVRLPRSQVKHKPSSVDSGLTNIYDISPPPPKSRGAAQIVLTGDEEFVRIVRLAAARQGMCLNEYGLWRWHTSEEASSEYQSDDDADADDADYAADVDPDGEAEAEADKKRRRPNGCWELVEGENEERI